MHKKLFVILCFKKVSSLCIHLENPLPSESLKEQRSQAADRHEDPELSSWLRLSGADQDSIDRVGSGFVLDQCNFFYI